MPCYYPLPADRRPGGGKLLVHSRLNPPANYQLKIPCGRCIGCRLDRTKSWAIRLMHEAQLHDETSFITLTYDNEHLACQESLTRLRFAPTRSLEKRHVQLFMKRLRRDDKSSTPIKFYACGEYGERLQRPHYHIALFGKDFRQDRYHYKTIKGFKHYRSPTLEKLWDYGFSDIGDLTIETAMYIASYVTKKVTGKNAPEHYTRYDQYTDEPYQVEPEFALMSRGGRRGRGIAYDWFTKYSTDVYPDDFAVHKNTKHKPPRYYDQLLEQLCPTTSALIKFQREMRGKLLAGDNTPARLADKETVTKAKMALKKRPLEST